MKAIVTHRNCLHLPSLSDKQGDLCKHPEGGEYFTNCQKSTAKKLNIKQSGYAQQTWIVNGSVYR